MLAAHTHAVREREMENERYRGTCVLIKVVADIFAARATLKAIGTATLAQVKEVPA